MAARKPGRYIVGEELRRIMVNKAVAKVLEFRKRLVEEGRAKRKKGGKK